MAPLDLPSIVNLVRFVPYDLYILWLLIHFWPLCHRPPPTNLSPLSLTGARRGGYRGPWEDQLHHQHQL